MRKSLFFTIIVLSMLAYSCSKETELTSSIYIADPDAYDLPQYSEWGYNTFGVYYDKEAFTSSSSIIPLKVLAHNDTTYFIFHGEKDRERMKFIIEVKDLYPKNYKDLLVLNDSTFNLSNSNYTAYFIKYNDTIRLNILSGNIHFKRAQKLLVDQVQEEVILSGTFELKFLLNNEPFSMTSGRFDIGVGEPNFFSY